MLQEFSASNAVDADGNPAGGTVSGTGLSISWQDGPLGGGAPSGAFVETVIAAAIQRIEFYETAKDGAFSCRENRAALHALGEALRHLERRTARRERAGIEGTHVEDESLDSPRSELSEEDEYEAAGLAADADAANEAAEIAASEGDA